MPDFEIIDRYGRRRRARPGEGYGTLKDGERIHFPMQFTDEHMRVRAEVLDSYAAAIFATRVVDAHGDVTVHRPGYLFDQNRAFADDGALRRSRHAAEEAYVARSRRLQDAWRNRKRREDVDDEDRDPIRTLDAAHLREIADQAWQDRKIRISNMWRQRHVSR